MILKIPFHSLADVITNSSSVEYVWSTDRTIETLKELIQVVLDSLHITTPIDEIVSITYEVSPYWIEDERKKWEEGYRDYNTQELSEEEFEQYLRDGVGYDRDSNWIGHTHLCIKIKDTDTMLGRRLESMFEVCSVYHS